MRAVQQSGLIGQGIYDDIDVARLVRLDPRTVSHWTTLGEGRRRAPVVLTPSLGDLFSFHDLISLSLAVELWRRGVALVEVRRGMDYLAQKLGTSRPFAHERLATSGNSFVAELGDEWLDVGKGGQGTFQQVVTPWIRLLEYGPDRMASLWRPYRRILLNPRVQAGAPCIEGTRVPTGVIANLRKAGEEPDDIADDLEVEVSDVIAALQFEASLVDASAG